MAKVSVVITVYNIDKYISNCIDSIVNQTFSDIEIIIVNDGSTDNSKHIIDDLAGKDSRIKCIHKQNEGVVLARKDGVDLATGEYLFHADGDDYLESNTLEIAYNTAKSKEADVAVIPFQFVFPDRTEHSTPYPKQEYSNIDFLKLLWGGEGYYAPWTYICLRELYKDMDFDPHLYFAEDAYMATQLFYKANKIVIAKSAPLYNYMQRDGSIMNKPFTEKSAKGMSDYPEYIIKFMKDKPEYPELQESLEGFRVISNCLLIQRGWYIDLKKRCWEINKSLHKYPNLKSLPLVIRIRKLILLFSINSLLGYTWFYYYKLKGKLR